MEDTSRAIICCTPTVRLLIVLTCHPAIAVLSTGYLPLGTGGHAPPNPDPAHFEHLSFFCPVPHLRLRGEGIGSSLAFRISRSNDLGQAFCRWFLYTHLNITYFAHMHTLLNKPAATFSGHTV